MVIMDVLSVASNGVRIPLHLQLLISHRQIVQGCIITRFSRGRVSLRFSPQDVFSTSANRVRSIILSRFILNLRSDTIELAISTANGSTIEFAQRVEDGFGGILNSFWRGNNDENDEGSGSQYLESKREQPTSQLGKQGEEI